MTKLYELTGQMKELEKLLDDDEMALAIHDTMDGIIGEFNDKAQGLASIMFNIDGDIGAIDHEIKRLQAKKEQFNNTKQSMNNYLRENMKASGIKKITCPLFSITLAKGRDVVVIDDEALIPDEYVTVKTVIAPDKRKLMKAMKEGEAIPGAHTEETEPSIRIK